MKRNRVNVLTVVNSASNITTETIDGKPHIVVRGITPVVDDIVMNRKLYPAAEIEKAYNTLERNPMPLGHPKVDGKHVSARDVRAVNEYHVGAWLQNVSHEDGKVTGDMYVNRQYAESSEKGKRLINRLDEMISGTNSEPIHISTGLLYSGIAANGESKGKKYNEIATNMMFDHVAVLLDELAPELRKKAWASSSTQKVMSSRSKLLALLMVSTAPEKVCSTRQNSSSPTPPTSLLTTFHAPSATSCVRVTQKISGYGQKRCGQTASSTAMTPDT